MILIPRAFLHEHKILNIYFQRILRTLQTPYANSALISLVRWKKLANKFGIHTSDWNQFNWTSIYLNSISLNIYVITKCKLLPVDSFDYKDISRFYISNTTEVYVFTKAILLADLRYISQTSFTRHSCVRMQSRAGIETSNIFILNDVYTYNLQESGRTCAIRYTPMWWVAIS